jgi:hypothetical protein
MNDCQESISLLEQTFARLLDRYRDDPQYEIEIRFGWKPSHTFQTDIGKPLFECITNTLNTADHSVFKTFTDQSDIYIYENYRIVVQNGQIQRIERKRKVHHLDMALHGTPYDIRFSICEEQPVSIQELGPSFCLNKAERIRSKYRTRFQYKFWNYDLTVVDTIHGKVYECELELHKPNLQSDMTNEYIASSGIMKVLDLIRMNVDHCEEIYLKSCSKM